MKAGFALHSASPLLISSPGPKPEEQHHHGDLGPPTDQPYLNDPSLRFSSWGAGEMAQQLRTLAVLPEDPGSIPITHMAAHNCNNSFRGSDIFTPMHIKNK